MASSILNVYAHNSDEVVSDISETWPVNEKALQYIHNNLAFLVVLLPGEVPDSQRIDGYAISISPMASRGFYSPSSSTQSPLYHASDGVILFTPRWAHILRWTKMILQRAEGNSSKPEIFSP